MNLSRRSVLKAGAAVGGGFVIGVFDASAADQSAPKKVFAPNAWLRVRPDGPIQFVLDRAEMGQGVSTGLAMLVAEELGVDTKSLELTFAPADRAYDNAEFGLQLTGGSTSVKTSWQPLRAAGAMAREMLRDAAARTWKVPVAECVAAGGVVKHGQKQATYAELSDAASQSKPREVAPKEKNFTVVGTSVDRLDVRGKVDGTAVYGIDVKVPDAKVAVIVRCQVPGGTPRSFDASALKAVPGIEKVVSISNGVAIVAKRYWQARRAAPLLKVVWDEGANAGLDTEKLKARYQKLAADDDGLTVREQGDVTAALAAATTNISAEYFAPYLAHAPMEPQNATAWVQDDRCDVWAPTQGAGMAREAVRRLTGLPYEAISIHQTWLGGGFGRRIHQDYVIEAVELSKAIKGPVKVIWSREDDMRHSPYRPMSYGKLEAGLDAKGNVTAWRHKTVGQSIVAQVGPDFLNNLMPNGVPRFMKDALGKVGSGVYRGNLVDGSAVEGADKVPYAIPAYDVRWVFEDPGVPVGFWRSVGHSHQAFVVESFIDELAHAAGKDPFEFRQALLKRAHRNRWVLEMVADKAGWSKPLPKGTFRGIAQHHSFDSWAAAVAEVQVSGTEINVKRVVIAIDCGRIVNPLLVKAQLESSTIFGLSAALHQQITFKDGKVQQSNFDDFAPLRMSEAPVIETYLAENQAAPTGVGEPGVPVIAPAVANAVFAATGKRLRSLPLVLG